MLSKSIGCLHKAADISRSAVRAFEDTSIALSLRAEVLSAVLRVIERSCPPLVSEAAEGLSVCDFFRIERSCSPLVVACDCL
jgi:hypothetical protein